MTKISTFAAVDFSDDQLIDAHRSRLYKLLSLGFGFPGEVLQEGQEELWQLADKLYPDMCLSIKPTDLLSQEVQSWYINVIDGHSKAMSCQPYESAWVKTDRATRQLEVKKFYRFFGLDLSKAVRELPDHIAHELEFMHYLAHQALLAGTMPTGDGTDRRAQYVHAQKDFLEQHLSKWVPSFCNALKRQAGVPFYEQLAEFTAYLVEDDLEYMCEQFQGLAVNG
ncbi:MAG: hypothetical protein GY935_14585 [Gammaproteobacteria bacterium]|nr:hypothetical protein [Gammaproteobacteria bacterium]